MKDALYKIVWESVSPAITQKIISGCAKIAPNGGVVYEGGKILTHLPLKAVDNSSSFLSSLLTGGPLSIVKTASSIVNTGSSLAANVQLRNVSRDLVHIQEDISSLLSLSQTNVLLTVCSSAVVVGAIVLSAKYLSKKMDEISRRLSNIEYLLKEIRQQQIYEYIKKYHAALQTITVYTDQNKASLTKDNIFQGQLQSLTSHRHNLLMECSSLKNTMLSTHSEEYAHLCYTFIEDTLQVLPYGMMMEYSLFCRLEEFLIADRYATHFYEYYNSLKYDTLQYAFNEKKKFVLGEQHALNIEKNALQNINKVGINEYIVTIPQGVPKQLKALEDQNKQFYIPR